MPPVLTFEHGIPMHDGTPELLEEYLYRADTLKVGNTQEVAKETGPLGPRLYNALRGEAYTGVNAANIAKADLGSDSKIEALVSALKAAIQGIEPNRADELLDRYFDNSSRRSAESVSSCLTKRSEVGQQLLGADRLTQSSDNIEAYLLLKLSSLSKAQRSQALASCGNAYDPKRLTEAIRVQFADPHKSE
ncbi:unnamed protein product, partial [Prorocentrum cordatum]